MSVAPFLESKLQFSRSTPPGRQAPTTDDGHHEPRAVELFTKTKGIVSSPSPDSPSSNEKHDMLRRVSSGNIELPAKFTFRQAFGPLGVPFLILVIVCILWTSWLIFLTIAPNEAANMLMNTGAYDNGNFWLIVERVPMVKWGSVAGLLLVTACYFLLLVRMLCFRHTVAEICKTKSDIAIMRVLSTLWLLYCTPKTKHRLRRLHGSYSNLTGFNAINRKFFNMFQKTLDLVVQGLVLRRSFNQGLPDSLIYGYASFIAINGLSVAMNILTRKNSAFAEVLIDSMFDLVAAVLFPIAVLLYCYYNFSFDREVFLVNAEFLPDGNFERYARMQADPAEVALFLINFNSLRIASAMDFALGIGMNLSFCYRFFRVISAIVIQRWLAQNLQVQFPLKLKERQRPVPRWVSLIFLSTSTLTIIYAHLSVARSHEACAVYPECVASAHVLNPGENCPCLMMIDGDRAPKTAQEWNFPEDVTDKVRALAEAGLLHGLQLINRQLRHWPDELRRCKDIRTISLLYTSTEEIPSWAKEFKHLQHLHLEGKFGSRNLAALPSDLFSDLPEFTFLHLGNHHNLLSLPNFDGTPNLRSLALAVLLSVTELPPFDHLPTLETMALAHLHRVSAVPDMAPLVSLSRFAVFRPNHLCCNGFIGDCNLRDSFCQPDTIFNVPGAECLDPNDPRHATSATRQVFMDFSFAVCQKSPVPFALEALSDFPTAERIAACDGVMYRQCEIPGVTSGNGTVGMCYSSRMQVVACNVDQLFIQVRRAQIERGVGSPCNPEAEAWLL